MRNEHVQQLEKILNDHLDVEDVSWPQLCRKEGTAAKGKVLVWGNLVLDVPLKTNTSLADFISALNNGDEKIRCEWEVAEPTVGGFVGQVAPIAAALGYQVHLSCSIAVPTPNQIRGFLESGRYDTRNVVVLPGKAPASIELDFSDGHVMLARRGVGARAGHTIPSNAIDEFDIILTNLGPIEGRPKRLRTLMAGCQTRNGCTVAMVARGDWTRDDLRMLRGTDAWVFFNAAEAIEAVRRIPGNDITSNVFEAATEIKSVLGPSPRLMVTLGKDGALLFGKGHAEPRELGTTPVENGQAVGGGDTLAVYASLGSAVGMSDEDAAALGVLAATTRVQGYPLPGLPLSDV